MHARAHEHSSMQATARPDQAGGVTTTCAVRAPPQAAWALVHERPRLSRWGRACVVLIAGLGDRVPASSLTAQPGAPGWLARRGR